MKEVIANIDVNCLNGVCEHVEHKLNALWWLAAVGCLVYCTVRIFRRRTVDNQD